MAEYKLSELYKQTKPFMEVDGNKRRKPVQDLRVQTLLAQDAAKRQCQGHSADPQAYAGMQQQEQLQQQQQQYVQQQTENAKQQDSRQPDTDFRGFFQHLNQQKQQQPGCQQQHQQEQQHLGDGSSRCPEQQQQQPGMFLDQLLSQHSLNHAPAPKGQLQNLMSIDRTFPPDASRDGFIRAGTDPHAAGGSAGPAAAAAAGGGLERFHLRHLELLPWDWSVKCRVRLSSAAPFAVLEEQRGAGLESACHALAAGAQCREAATLSNQERLSQVLLQYQYPASPLGANLIAALRSIDTKEGPASLTTRVAAWRDALRSAYIALRHGHCPVLYVVGQAFRQPLTVVFCSPGLMGCSQLHAVLGRSNKALRQHLAGFGVEGVLAGAMEQQAAGQQTGQRQPLPSAAFDGQPGSQLLVSGALQVHSLYAALLALPWCGQDQPDVPLVAAPVQFMHAQLCPLRLEVLPDAVLEQQQRPGDAAAAVPQPLHYAELSGSPGIIMPWTLHRLVSLMQDTQAQPGFDVYLETEPSSSCLNLLPDTWQQARRAAAEAGEAAAAAAAGLASCRQVWQDQGRGLSGAEEAGWQVSRSLLQGRVLGQVRVKDGEVAARLA